MGDPGGARAAAAAAIHVPQVWLLVWLLRWCACDGALMHSTASLRSTFAAPCAPLQVARLLPGPAGKLQQLAAAGALQQATPDALGLHAGSQMCATQLSRFSAHDDVMFRTPLWAAAQAYAAQDGSASGGLLLACVLLLLAAAACACSTPARSRCACCHTRPVSRCATRAAGPMLTVQQAKALLVGKASRVSGGMAPATQRLRVAAQPCACCKHTQCRRQARVLTPGCCACVPPTTDAGDAGVICSLWPGQCLCARTGGARHHALMLVCSHMR
jgi:hypothetical protein